MKTTIVGTHGVGKTTLFNLLKEEGTLEQINETARELMGLINQSTADMNNTERGFFQQVALNHQIWKEIEYKDTGFVADRCVIDYLAYSEGLPFYGILYDQVKYHLDRNGGYDKVFYLPIEFALEVDDIRFTNDEFQKVIDQRMVRLMKEFRIEYITLTGTVDNRMSTIRQELQVIA